MPRPPTRTPKLEAGYRARSIVVVAIYYVDRDGGSDLNGGSSEGGPIALGANADTDGTATVDLSTDTPDLSGVSVGDIIRINGHIDGINGSDLFEITAVDDVLDTVTVTPSPSLGTGQTWVIGGAFGFIDRAMNVVLPGDKVFVKASNTYAETPSIDTAGTSTSPIVFEGYTTTPGDGGQAFVLGELTDSISSRLYYVFKNFDIDNTSGSGGGTCVNLDGTETVWKNCRFHNNTAIALVSVGNHAGFENCEFNDATGDGCQCASAVFVGCKFYRSSLAGIDASAHCICIFCEFFSNGSEAIDGGATNETFVVAINCTIDGDSKDTTTGIVKNVSIHGMVVAVNNIVYDCATGMTWGAGGTDNSEFGISRNNLLNNNSTDYTSGAFTSEGEVTGAPSFTDEAANIYSLSSSSPAAGAGYDLGQFASMGSRQAKTGVDSPPLYPWYIGGPG